MKNQNENKMQRPTPTHLNVIRVVAQYQRIWPWQRVKPVDIDFVARKIGLPSSELRRYVNRLVAVGALEVVDARDRVERLQVPEKSSAVLR